ncbi:bifunctional ADP-dependent NAD(P)H-hydrate dehydratase/NAD(P)H-hydrate epimerase [Candidatus Berkiella cookevillensis]|uniref:Bifunctional NAD(P)H-hydrate repair enzyme n=1 Tax=Candidatus Berkiella cookevillensis TaxID=437022 RepID=A0A0Q9YG81_9GAMM|nr:bifunctional ADP-dependent NAD(P)H-hydrate dehydratase/NAD(P)H-hydrate epimerase [Candidatus Berkiella cookevillensis]MCS5707545.1 bifunctional ADP-dependent NAD(P)H-hydrate dehydratase/NAD(P)H-hydrate epimerase [Candidatus Berkiella cookevillensis]
MESLPTSLYTAQAVREIDHVAIAHEKISAYTLMSRAGQTAFEIFKKRWPMAQKILVCCGSGNNGGDGFVFARIAQAAGLSITVYDVKPIDMQRLSVEARQAREAWLSSGHAVSPFNEIDFLEVDVVIDAILGTGLQNELDEAYVRAITIVNQAKAQQGIGVFALDVPSGLNADTGTISTVAIKADVTLTFIGLKIGLFCADAYDWVGQLYFDDLGVDASVYRIVRPRAHRFDYETIQEKLPLKKLTQHKGQNGHVLVIGGGEIHYSGAACLCAEAAYRSGAGLVSVVVSPEALPLMARAAPELMIYPLVKFSELETLIEKADVIVIGPGLGQNKWSKRVFSLVKTVHHKPLIVDADALNLLACDPMHNPHWILTPHPGEASRLLNHSITDVQSERSSAIEALQQKLGGVIVLKGAGTLIKSADRPPFLYSEALPVLATAGTGDVLAGIIAGLRAQGLSSLEASQCGVAVHGQAAKQEQVLGDRGMMASDLFLHIRSLLSICS